jgi:hypothetical protein
LRAALSGPPSVFVGACTNVLRNCSWFFAAKKRGVKSGSDGASTRDRHHIEIRA